VTGCGLDDRGSISGRDIIFLFFVSRSDRPWGPSGLASLDSWLYAKLKFSSQIFIIL